MTKKKVTVAEYLEQLINMSDKSQKQIAAEVGYDKPNMITMIKQGATKLPLNKVGVFAKSLGIDPMHLFRIAMEEYMPETMQVMDEFMGPALVTQDEVELVKLFRQMAGGQEIGIKGNRAFREAITSELKPLVKKEVENRQRGLVRAG